MSIRMQVLIGLAAVGLGGCAGGTGALGTSNQVLVTLDADISDVVGAQAIAERDCASRGRRARFVLLQSASSGGSQNGFTLRPPVAVFACDPAAPPRS